LAGSRQIFDLAVDLVQTSCGTGVPEMAFARDRGPEELVPFYEDMGPEGVEDYWRRKNVETIDGRPTGIFG
ncbi:MAG: pyridoxamine 5'-phosphate oxidase family protein, partial [Pseudomonadota bacterium]